MWITPTYIQMVSVHLPLIILYSMLVLLWYNGLKHKMHSQSGPSIYVCHARRICGEVPLSVCKS